MLPSTSISNREPTRTWRRDKGRNTRVAQNRVNGALSQLPAEATKTGVTTEKQQNAELMTFALYSPDDRFDQTFLNNYVKINVEPRLKRISGVGKAQLFGSNYSMRLWLRPDKMAQ